jgi:outer membrane lipase/esterase
MAALGAAVMLCGAMTATAGAASSSPYNGLVVFGDSLSDNGNAGRFSNGPVWVEVIARRIGTELEPSRAGGTDYAVGGALTHGGPTDVRGQLMTYLSAHDGRTDPETLYIVYGGANDLLAAGCQSKRDAAARGAAAAIAASVDDLAAAGARHILVPNLPDIGYAPMVRALGPTCASEARRRTRVFNAALDKRLTRVERKRSITLERLDVFSLADQVMRDPQAAGFGNVTQPCINGSCEGALFWDRVHPTSEAHQRLAAAALEAIGLGTDR